MFTWNCVNRVNGSNMHLTGNGINGTQNGMHVISAKVDGIANDIATRNRCKYFYPSYAQWRSDDNYLHMCFISRVCTFSEMTNIKMFNQSNQWDIYISPCLQMPKYYNWLQTYIYAVHIIPLKLNRFCKKSTPRNKTAFIMIMMLWFKEKKCYNSLVISKIVGLLVPYFGLWK